VRALLRVEHGERADEHAFGADQRHHADESCARAGADQGMLAPGALPCILDEEGLAQAHAVQRERTLGGQLREAHADPCAQEFVPRIDEGQPGDRRSRRFGGAPDQLVEGRLRDPRARRLQGQAISQITGA
jgi:hypothetical protein